MELVSVSLIQYVLCEPYDNEKLYGMLKNVAYYLHQNFTNVIGTTITAINSSSASVSALANLLQIRKGANVKPNEYTQSLCQYNNLLINLLKNLCRIAVESFLNDKSGQNSTRARSKKLYQHKPIYVASLSTLKQLDRTSASVSGLREIFRSALKKSMRILRRQGLVWSTENALSAIKAPFLPPMNEAPAGIVSEKQSEENTEQIGITDKEVQENKETAANQDDTENEDAATKGREYTLVLDLDETLAHYKETRGKGKLLMRPGVESFLKETSKCYEIVIFTAAMSEVELVCMVVCCLGAWHNRPKQKIHCTQTVQRAHKAIGFAFCQRPGQHRARFEQGDNRGQSGGEFPAAAREWDHR
eukprot:TRINITY_DN3985_c0_g7_i1.p1 TRINITY_DN3985_c0_g7~~TRINITY_DN3985_c0_g7_i1.p1  ORF type:complete len:384 (-),score=23.42 TRINITY_DN3985_c0_g7_i1:280-1359(-)